jgi:hypothetical protein
MRVHPRRGQIRKIYLILNNQIIASIALGPSPIAVRYSDRSAALAALGQARLSH